MSGKGYTKDTKVWTQMKKNLRKGKSQINLGWFEGQNYGPDNGNLPMAQVAQWVEEGHVNGGIFSGTITPPRPAIRTMFIPTIAEADEFVARAIPMINSVAQGKMTWKKLHEKLAPSVLHLFKYTLKSYNIIPNKPVTVKLKGFNDPWVETGTLIESARFDVVPMKAYSSKAYKPQMLMFA